MEPPSPRCRQRRDSDVHVSIVGERRGLMARNPEFSSYICQQQKNSVGHAQDHRLIAANPAHQGGGRRVGHSPKNMTLTFVAHALISFVGVVLIPSRLAWEVLVVQSPPQHQSSLFGMMTAANVESSEAIFRGLRVEEIPVGTSGTRGGRRSIRRPGIVAWEGVGKAGRAGGEDWVSLSLGDHGGRGDALGDNSKSGANTRNSGRRTLQEEEESFTYTSITKFHLCSQIQNLTQAVMEDAVLEVFGVEASQVTEGSGEVVESPNSEFCGDTDVAQWSISIVNEGDDSESAAVMSAKQGDILREAGFPDVMAKAIVANGGPAVEGDDLSVTSLGFAIDFDEDQADPPSSGGLGKDFQDVWGPDQYWPWWSWILFPVGVLLCCPVVCCIFMNRTGPSGPPSPSGPAGGPGTFGGKAGGSKGGKEYDPTMSAADFDAKEFEKTAKAGYLDGGESGSVAATAIDSPTEYVNPITGSAFTGEPQPEVGADVATRELQGNWPEAAEGSSTEKFTEAGADTETSGHLSEADRAAGQHGDALSLPLGAAATSGATIAAAAAAYNRSDSNISAPDSQTSSEDSRSHTDPWMKGQEMSGGVSGRSLGDAAAALGSSHDDDDDGDQYQPAADMATSAGGLSYAPSGRQMMAGAGEMGLGDPNTRSTAGSALGTVTNSFAPSTAESTRSMSQSTSRPTFDRQDESVASIGGDMVAGTSFRSNSGGTYPIPPSSTSGFQESTSLATEEVRAEREAHELELAASGKEDSEVVIGAAAAAAAALGAGGGGLPSSRLSGGSRNSSFDATKGRPAHRVSSVGSMDAGALRELTDEEQLQRTQEADAARAASLLRASAVKVPLDPELERATSKEEQARRRHVIEEMEQQLAPSSGGGGGGGGGGRGVVDPSPADVSGSTPPSTSTSVVGKVLAGMGMGRFFGGGTLAEEPRSSTGAAPSIAETPSSQVTAGPAPSAATAPSVSGGGGLGAVAESPASAAARVAAASSAAAATAADGRSATTDDFQTAGEILIAPSDAGTHGGSLPQEGPTPGPRGTGPIEGAGERSSTFDAEMTGLQADSLAWRQQQGDWMRTKEDAGVGGGVTSAAAAGAALAMEDDAVLRGRSLGPEEKQAYSDNVDRTLQDLDVGQEGGESMPMSELLARAEVEVAAAATGRTLEPPPGSRSVPPSESISTRAGAPSVAAPAAASTVRSSGLPPPGPGQAAALALQQQSALGSTAPTLDLARLIHNAEEGGMTLEELEATLASPIVATPPALLRPGVGPAARGAAGRGQSHVGRPAVSGSFTSRSTSATSNTNYTEDEMSSGQTTDVSRTSSFQAQSSFEDARHAQAAQAHRYQQEPPGAAAGGVTAGTGLGGPQGSSSLAEHLARAEDKVGRGYEKGLLYRQGPEGVAAAVAGEEIPMNVSATAGAAPGGGARAGDVDVDVVGQGRIESLADMLAQADDGPGNLKELFQRLDAMEAKRLEDLNAAASAADADDETKARWRGSLAELMAKADQTGHLRGVLDLHENSAISESAPSEGNWGQDYITSASSVGSAMWGATAGQDSKAQSKSRSE